MYRLVQSRGNFMVRPDPIDLHGLHAGRDAVVVKTEAVIRDCLLRPSWKAGACWFAAMTRNETASIPHLKRSTHSCG